MKFINKFNCLIMSMLIFSISAFGDVNPYLQKREGLLSFGNNLRFSSGEVLNGKETIVNNYLKDLQGKEKNEYSSQEAINDILAGGHRFLNNPLMHFMKEMPKGGVLHIHSTALGDLSWILSKAMEEPNCYIYVGEGEGKWIKGSMHMFKEAPSGPWKRVMDLKKENETDQQFQQRLHRLVKLDVQDLGKDVWDRFEDCFTRVKGLVRYLPFRKEFLERCFLEYASQNVQYLEIRSSIPKLYDLEGNEYNDADYVSIYNDAVKEVQKNYPHFSVKLIQAAHRQANVDEMKEFLHRFDKIRAMYPQMIVGFDIVNQEDGSNSQYYYLNELLKHKHENRNVAYFFHAGESNERENDNVLDSILLGTRRIGHGLSMASQPHLMQLAKKRNIAVEVCPISNQVLGFVGDQRNHPARVMMNFGVPIVLAPDDPGMMGYPFSYDFYQACVYWDLDLKDLKQLSKNSLMHSAMKKGEKKKAMKVWQKNWDRFISNAYSRINKEAV